MKIPASFIALKALINGKSFAAARQQVKDRRLAKGMLARIGGGIGGQHEIIRDGELRVEALAEHAANMAKRPAYARRAYLEPMHTVVRPMPDAPRQKK